jgi:hypothetical protein
MREPCPSRDSRGRYYDIRVAQGREVVALEPTLLKGRHSFATSWSQVRPIAGA